VLWVVEGVKVHAFMCKAAPGLVGVELWKWLRESGAGLISTCSNLFQEGASRGWARRELPWGLIVPLVRVFRSDGWMLLGEDV
jgi:hypothetical protein